MDNNKIYQVMSVLRDKITPQQNFIVSETLRKTDDKAFTELMMLPYKNSIANILLGVFLGRYGANRFYVGDKKIGIVKLILGVIFTVFNVIILIMALQNYQLILVLDLLYTLLLTAYGIFNIFDIFMCLKAGKNINYEMIMKTLEKYPQTSQTFTESEFDDAMKADIITDIFPDVFSNKEN